jgi:drug/metabolite transporter (DMT)-like permease
MKESCQILSSSFIKILGFCISIFLFLNCSKLFLQKSRLFNQGENKYLLWLIIGGVLVIVVFFLCLFLAT